MKSQVSPQTVTMMENHATKMRTTKDKRQTRMFHRELCFAAGGSIGKRKSETERGVWFEK